MQTKTTQSRKKVAIVTGSATGVGAATAIELSQLGWNVVINYSRSRNEAEETANHCREAGAQVMVIRADVSDDSECRAMVTSTVKQWGRIDALVNNAGTTKFCHLSDLDGLTHEDFLHLYSVNVVGAFQMARAVAPHLRSVKGCIVNTASIAGLTGMGSSIAYAASKGAMVTMTLSLAHALSPDIRVNAVCPGFIQGRWTKGFLGDRYDQVRQEVEESATLQITATPSDIAESLVYLITKAKIITGEIMIVDGGSTLKQVTLGRR